MLKLRVKVSAPYIGKVKFHFLLQKLRIKKASAGIAEYINPALLLGT